MPHCHCADIFHHAVSKKEKASLSFSSKEKSRRDVESFEKCRNDLVEKLKKSKFGDSFPIDSGSLLVLAAHWCSSRSWGCETLTLGHVRLRARTLSSLCKDHLVAQGVARSVFIKDFHAHFITCLSSHFYSFSVLNFNYHVEIAER